MAMSLLDHDEQTTRWHVVERVQLAALGQTPPFIDGQNTAIAAANGLTMVMAIVRDFAQFSGLTLADWRGDQVVRQAASQPPNYTISTIG